MFQDRESSLFILVISIPVVNIVFQIYIGIAPIAYLTFLNVLKLDR